MSKNVKFNKETLSKLLIGLDKCADAVAGTMGPKGRNVFVDDEATPSIINDGATVSRNIFLEDKEENAGAYLIRNVSGQQNDDVGDGTTTVAVLTQSLVHECLKRPENPMEIKQSLKEAGDKVLKILAKKSQKITKKDVEKVALISAETKELAKPIKEIIDKLGEKAVINVEDSRTFGTEYEIMDGYDAPVGFLSPYFINDRKSSRAVYENVPVLVSEKKISNIVDIAPLFEIFKKDGTTSCVIFCEDIEDAMLGIFVNNKNMGIFNTLVIRANGPLLQDIQEVVGAKAVSESTGVSFKNIKPEHLGKAKKIVSDANKTIIFSNSVAAKIHASNLLKRADQEHNMFTAQKLRERANKLKGGIAVLRVGASTDFERNYLRLKAEDAVKAVQAALEEGVVEGGGMALWRIAMELKGKTIGEQVLKESLKAPLKKIIENAGKDYTEVILNMPQGQGYNAKTNDYADLKATGIIDPTKVERCAVENAVSAASVFITTFCTITNHEEKK